MSKFHSYFCKLKKRGFVTDLASSPKSHPESPHWPTPSDMTPQLRGPKLRQTSFRDLLHTWEWFPHYLWSTTFFVIFGPGRPSTAFGLFSLRHGPGQVPSATIFRPPTNKRVLFWGPEKARWGPSRWASSWRRLSHPPQKARWGASPSARSVRGNLRNTAKLTRQFQVWTRGWCVTDLASSLGRHPNTCVLREIPRFCTSSYRNSYRSSETGSKAVISDVGRQVALACWPGCTRTIKLILPNLNFSSRRLTPLNFATHNQVPTLARHCFPRRVPDLASSVARTHTRIFGT